VFRARYALIPYTKRKCLVFKGLISNFTDNRPVGDALVRADGGTDGRTDMTKVIGAFRDYANGSEKIDGEEKTGFIRDSN
jgi:hypothetical protein